MSGNLFEKYAEEKQKRLRANGLDQYIDLRFAESDLQKLARDPWVDYESPIIKSPPLKNGSSIKFLICGGGHSGILYAVRLIEAGFSREDIVIVDIAGGLGGTWYWNRYPGLMCDVEGFVYLPLLEETGYVPKHKYSYGDEIRGQSERIAAKWGLQGQFCTKVDKQVWDEQRHQWVVDLRRTFTKDGASEPEKLTVYADFVVAAGGVLSVPKVPKLAGWSDFRANKHTFHTSRWDYAYTGGSQEKPDMTKLKGKRVAIIGTGATAVQVVPELAKWADHLYVVQRTPSHCGPRNQAEVTPELWSKVADGPGWQDRRRRNFNSRVTHNPEPVDLVNDGWTHVPAASGAIGSDRWTVTPDQVPEHVQRLFELDREATDEFRARISREVKDPAVAEKLKAWYGTWCKRPTFHDDYLAAFNRPNVTLIDTNGKGLERLTANGIVFDGVEYDVDCLVLATGFVATNRNGLDARIDAPVIGRGGVSMADEWEKPGASTAFGLFMPSFPNLAATFYRGGAFSYNLSSVYDMFAQLYARIMTVLHENRRGGDSGGKLVFEVSQQTLDRWADEVAKRAAWLLGGTNCTPSIYNDEGEAFASDESLVKGADADEKKKRFQNKARGTSWGTGPLDYQKTITKYMADEAGLLRDFVVNVV
ncbi:hypothetical protein DHEL01_v212958 [Diaporthe helianthi]|uniref:Phenylacetone monooxygenase n=1 Tax=Diaporthe helianthi TaxID=158607 RepID=A0A2P5HEG4_DIAHE|nr:hypothetical protein DHEL01_v212958 [Diaporthe helianthi]